MSSTHICVLVPRPSTNRPTVRQAVEVDRGHRRLEGAESVGDGDTAAQLHALGHCRAVPEGHERRAVDLRAEDPCQTGGFNLLRLGGQDRPGARSAPIRPTVGCCRFHVVRGSGACTTDGGQGGPGSEGSLPAGSEIPRRWQPRQGRRRQAAEVGRFRFVRCPALPDTSHPSSPECSSLSAHGFQKVFVSGLGGTAAMFSNVGRAGSVGRLRRTDQLLRVLGAGVLAGRLAVRTEPTRDGLIAITWVRRACTSACRRRVVAGRRPSNQRTVGAAGPAAGLGPVRCRRQWHGHTRAISATFVGCG